MSTSTVELPITTRRLLLRRYTGDDIEDILEFVAHSCVASAAPEIDATETGVREYIERQNSYQPFEENKCFDLAIQRKEDGKVIGLFSIVCTARRQAAIGYALGLGYRGQGYTTEAAQSFMDFGFVSLKLHRIYAETDSGNPKSWKVMERLGMRREGCFREAKFSDGEWLDILTYGMLAAEWHGKETRPG